jgi:hypothetical protein
MSLIDVKGGPGSVTKREGDYWVSDSCRAREWPSMGSEGIGPIRRGGEVSSQT